VNVLILSAGAKVLLVRSFRKAVAAWGGQVFACDMDPYSAALFEADRAFLVPRSDSDDFGSVLANLCERHAIKLVVPTSDRELGAVQRQAELLGAVGTTVLVPSAASLEICRDKRKFASFCMGSGFSVARIYGSGENPRDYPIFVRPTVSAGGVGARRLDSAEQFQALGKEAAGLVVQDYISDEEYTIDVLMDLKGGPVQAVARSRLVVRNGESQKSRVEHIEALTDGALNLCAALALVGHNVVQAFYSPAKGARYIEVNPRFGGASNLSIEAGLDSPRRLLQMVAGEKAMAMAPRAINYGLTLLRHSEDILVDPQAIAAIPRAD
jgi:carbamoyl-phosphate synthase large subunit